jgi:hypothetical protein
MFKRVVIATCMLAAVTGAKAEEEDKAKMMASLLETMGLKQTSNTSGSSCKIVTDADQAEIVKAVPVLQKLDLLNQDMSKNELMRKPTKTTFAMALQMASIQIKTLYETNSSVDKCFFVHNILSQDDYGNNRKDVMFSYQFDRATYSKINWDKFKSQSLVKVAKNFNLNPEVMARVNDE